MSYVQPGLTIVLILLVLAICQRTPTRKRRFLIAATTVLFLWSWQPVAWLLSSTLEGWYYPASRPSDSAEVDAIVVLGGGAEFHEFPEDEVVLGYDTYTRARYAAWLYKRWRALPVVVCGGTSATTAGRFSPVARMMAEELVRRGVPAAMISEESNSRSTYENAAFAAQILKRDGRMRIALVTEAFHMLRSQKVFERLGFTVHPAPCEFRTPPVTIEWPDLFPGPRGILQNERVLHEWVGLAWYRLSGKI